MASKPLIIGIAGGIGSGKSTACRIFEKLGIPVHYADDVAKDLMHSNPEVRLKITSLFGAQAYVDGQLNRPFIADQIFNSPERIAKMNSIVHPAVQRHFETWMQEQNSPYVLREAAILFETGGYTKNDANILVIAPVLTRIARVEKRSGLTEKQIRERISKQWEDERKIPLADYIIANGDGDQLLPQIWTIHEDLKRRANSKD